MLRVVWSSYRWATCDENDDEEKKTEGDASYCMETNILAASLSDRTVRLIDEHTGTYLSIMDFERDETGHVTTICWNKWGSSLARYY